MSARLGTHEAQVEVEQGERRRRERCAYLRKEGKQAGAKHEDRGRGRLTPVTVVRS